MTKGKIIFLNGTSSAGKSTLAKTLQERLNEPYYTIAADTFMGTGVMRPDKFCTKDDKGFEFYLRTQSGMHNTIKMYSDLGLNVIVDHVLTNYVLQNRNPKALEECTQLLHNYPVMFVRVICPPEELRRREIERGDREIGHAERLLPYVVPKDIYDITVDTHNETKEKCADRIIEFLEQTESHTSFKNIWHELKEKEPTP